MKKEYAKEYSDIRTIKRYFIRSGIHLSMLTPSKAEFFSEDMRKDYFSEAINHYKSLVNATLIYVDPDVGSDVGITRRFRSNKSLYIRKHELVSFQQNLRKGDILSYFQHLGDSNYTLQERVKDLNSTFGNLVMLVAYTRIQAAFVFIFSDQHTYIDKRKLIENYFKQYDHLKHREKLIILGKPLRPSGFFDL